MRVRRCLLALLRRVTQKMAVTRKAGNTIQVNGLVSWLSPLAVARSSTASVLLNSTLCVPTIALNRLYSTGSAAAQMRALRSPRLRAVVVGEAVRWQLLLLLLAADCCCCC